MKWIRTVSCLVLVTMVAAACASGFKGINESLRDAANGQAKEKRQFCADLATDADTYSRTYLATGILAALLSGAGVVAGTVMGPGPDDNWATKNRNALVIGSSALLAVPATLLLMRSKDADKAAADAGEALALSSSGEAFEKCLSVRSELIQSRSNIADYALQEIDKRVGSANEYVDCTKELEDLRRAKDALEKATSLDATKIQKAREDVDSKLEDCAKKYRRFRSLADDSGE
jgi:hypothetical protein